MTEGLTGRQFIILLSFRDVVSKTYYARVKENMKYTHTNSESVCAILPSQNAINNKIQFVCFMVLCALKIFFFFSFKLSCFKFAFMFKHVVSRSLIFSIVNFLKLSLQQTFMIILHFSFLLASAWQIELNICSAKEHIWMWIWNTLKIEMDSNRICSVNVTFWWEIVIDEMESS